VNIEDIDHIENQLRTQFDMVELGRLKLYLGFVLHLMKLELGCMSTTTLKSYYKNLTWSNVLFYKFP
jgi:hypothetical protein